MRENSPGVHHKMIVSSCKAKEPLILIQYITGRSNSIRAQNWQLSDWPPWYSFELLQWFIAMNASCTRTGTPLVIKLQRREQTNSWLNGQMNIGKHEDFRYMKIHIFALRWRDEIKRSSQLRTLLKRVVVNRTWKKFRPSHSLYLHVLSVATNA